MKINGDFSDNVWPKCVKKFHSKNRDEQIEICASTSM